MIDKYYIKQKFRTVWFDNQQDLGGVVYYNYASDMLFVRSIVHDFGGCYFDVLEDIENPKDSNIVFIGII